LKVEDSFNPRNSLLYLETATSYEVVVGQPLFGERPHGIRPSRRPGI
jgi:hypothetical protein